jgi:hypothetical protein
MGLKILPEGPAPTSETDFRPPTSTFSRAPELLWHLRKRYKSPLFEFELSMNVAVFDSQLFDQEALRNATQAANQLRFLPVRLIEDTAVLAKGSDAVCLFGNDRATCLRSGNSAEFQPRVAVNAVVLGNDVLVPDPFVQILRDQIAGTLKRNGLTAHFVDSGVYHGFTGDARCATNVVRTKSCHWRQRVSRDALSPFVAIDKTLGLQNCFGTDMYGT